MAVNTEQFRFRSNESLISSTNYFLKGETPVNDYYKSMITALVERGLDHKVDKEYQKKLRKIFGGDVNPNGKWVAGPYRLEDHVKVKNQGKFFTDGRIYINELEMEGNNKENNKYDSLSTNIILWRMFMVFNSENPDSQPICLTLCKSKSIDKWIVIISPKLQKFFGIVSKKYNSYYFDLSMNFSELLDTILLFLNDPQSYQFKKTIGEWISENFHTEQYIDITFPSYVDLLSSIKHQEIDRIFKKGEDDFNNPLSYSNVSEYIVVDNIAIGIYIDGNKNKRICVKRLEEKTE